MGAKGDVTMNDLISREALARKVMELTIVSPEVMNYANAIAVAIVDAPSVDAEPVRHGRWVETEYYDAHKTPIYQCSVCWKGVADHYITQHKFCLHCGAKMDGGAEDDH